MIDGHYSDNQRVTLDDGRSGVILRSLGHRIVLANRQPDESRGPQYEVLVNAKHVSRDGRMEWHGDEYVRVEEMKDQSLRELTD